MMSQELWLHVVKMMLMMMVLRTKYLLTTKLIMVSAGNTWLQARTCQDERRYINLSFMTDQDFKTEDDQLQHEKVPFPSSWVLLE